MQMLILKYSTQAEIVQKPVVMAQVYSKILFDENKDKNLLRIHSDAGILEAKKQGDDISVNMGDISTYWNEIPLIKNMDTMNIPILIDGYTKGVAVNIGNPT